jgi:sugar lactone lactonase YvrE
VGAAASFNFLGSFAVGNGTDSASGLTIDSAGNVYVADSGNNTIRKITPSGLVSTLAGTAGVMGSNDGLGGSASFSIPSGLTADSVGNIYVADLGNATIRKISPAGAVSTLAGTAGVTGYADGVGPAASFYVPAALAIDGAGNVYVADMYVSNIRKITPASVVSTFAGGGWGSADGVGAAASFKAPHGLATDSAGNVYVADSGNNVVRKISPAGVVSTVAGTAGAIGHADGAGGAATFPIRLGWLQTALAKST